MESLQRRYKSCKNIKQIKQVFGFKASPSDALYSAVYCHSKIPKEGWNFRIDSRHALRHAQRMTHDFGEFFSVRDFGEIESKVCCAILR